LQQHANTAKAIAQILIVSPEPKLEAAHLARLIEDEVQARTDGTFVVPSGPGRADFVFLTREQLGQQYPGVSLAGLPERGGAGLVLVANDLAAAQRATGTAAVASNGAVVVPPAAANGTLLAFVEG
jgi:hypothetical protein